MMTSQDNQELMCLYLTVIVVAELTASGAIVA